MDNAIALPKKYWSNENTGASFVFQIREPSATDLDSFIQIYAEFYLETYGDDPYATIKENGYSFDVVSMKINQINEEKSIILIAEHADEIIGFAVVNMIAMAYCFVRAVYVKPIFRGTEVFGAMRMVTKDGFGAVKYIFQSDKKIVPLGLAKNTKKKKIKELEKSIVWELEA